MTKEQLLSIIRSERTSSVRSLRNRLRKLNLEISDTELIGFLSELSGERLVTLELPVSPSSFSSYMTDFRGSGWVYVLLGLSLVETLLVESDSAEVFLVSVRLVLGFLLLGIIPGYAAVNLVFPTWKFSLLERCVLSVFLSLLISILTGTLLGSVGALGPTSNALVLTVVTFVLSIVAAYRVFDSRGRSEAPRT